MSPSKKLSRREVIGNTAAAGAAVPLVVATRALGDNKRPPASERIQVGLIGAGIMGPRNLASCAKYDDVVVTGICDVWKQRRDKLVDQYKPSARGYHDYREMLARDDVDAVIIATPGHWHALMAIHAAKAGKDLYLQKPMTLSVGECLAVQGAVKKHGVISQVGTQIHAGDNYRRVVEWIRSGRLGEVNVVRSFVVGNQGREGIGNPPNEDPPPGLDWKMWLGPRPMRPFNPVIVAGAYEHASFMAYGGGMTPGMAPHVIDLPYWALDLHSPVLVNAAGGRRMIDDAGDAPDSLEVLWQHGDVTMTWMMSLTNSYGFDFQDKPGIRGRLGVYFHGVNGTLYANYRTHEVVPEGDRLKDVEPPEQTIPPSPGHEREWLDSIKSRQQPSCNVFYHGKLDAAIGLANLSYELGRSIRYDPSAGRIVGDRQAQAAIVPEYADPWKFPEEYMYL
jgi:predicted dehydrogenase